MATFSPSPLTEVTAPPVGAATGVTAPPPATTNTAANINALTGLAKIGFESIGVFTDIAEGRAVSRFTKSLTAISAKSAAGELDASQQNALVTNLFVGAVQNDPELLPKFRQVMVDSGFPNPIATKNTAAEAARAELLKAGYLITGQEATTEQALEAGQKYIDNKRRVEVAAAASKIETERVVIDVAKQRQAGLNYVDALLRAAGTSAIGAAGRGLAAEADDPTEQQRVLAIRSGVLQLLGSVEQQVEEVTRLYAKEAREDTLAVMVKVREQLVGDDGVFGINGPLDFKVFSELSTMLEARTNLNSLQSFALINTLRKAIGPAALGVLVQQAILTLEGGAGMNQLIEALGQELNTSFGISDDNKMDARQMLSLLTSPDAAEKLADDPDFRRDEAIRYLDAIVTAMNRTATGVSILDTGYAAAMSNLVVLTDKFISKPENLSHVLEGLNKQGHLINLKALNEANSERAGLIGDRINTVAFKSLSTALADMELRGVFGGEYSIPEKRGGNFAEYVNGKFQIRELREVRKPGHPAGERRGEEPGSRDIITREKPPDHIVAAVALANLALDVAVKHREYNPAVIGTNATEAQVRDFMVNAGQILTTTDYTKGVPLDLSPFKTVGAATNAMTNRLPPSNRAFRENAAQLEEVVRKSNRALLTARLKGKQRTIPWTGK
jgi:hypothetical protein